MKADLKAPHRPDPYRPQHPPPGTSWWATKEVQQSRERFDEAIAEQAERWNDTSTNQHMQRKAGER